jgi:hypothetical protein
MLPTPALENQRIIKATPPEILRTVLIGNPDVTGKEVHMKHSGLRTQSDPALAF